MSPASYRAAPPRVGEHPLYVTRGGTQNRASARYIRLMTTMPPAPTPPPLGGAPRARWAAGRPTGLATATIGLTGGVAVATLLGAFASRAMYANFDKYVGSNPTIDGTYLASQGLSGLAFLLMLGSYITLALWMTKVHRRLTEAGEPQPLSEIWAWFVWLIPLANYVMPYIYFHGLNRRARSRAVGAWWLIYIGSGLASMVGGIQVFAASDFSAAFKDANDPLAGIDLSPLGTAGIVSAVLLVISWVFLASTLRTITARDLSPRVANPA